MQRLQLYTNSVRNMLGKAVGVEPYSAAQLAVARTIWDRVLTWPGCGEIDAACWVANTEGECSFDIRAPGDKNKLGVYTAFGIAQHHGDRRNIIKENTGIDMKTADLDGQLRGILWEITTKPSWYAHVLGSLVMATTITAKITVLVRDFEQSGSQARDIDRRSKMANYWLNRWGKGASGTVTVVAEDKPISKPVENAPAAASKVLVPRPIDPKWLPQCKMRGIVVHWTAGANKASEHDTEFYHILIEDDGKLIRGTHTIDDNVNTADGDYAAHTRKCNTGMIGVSLCGMAGAIEQPFRAGVQPITRKQWDVLAYVLAQLCAFYDIPPDREHVLSHAEVQDTLRIPQAGKWDICFLPWAPELTASLTSANARAHKIGDMFRKATAALI